LKGNTVGLTGAISWVRCASVSLLGSEKSSSDLSELLATFLWWVKPIFDISVLQLCPAMFRRECRLFAAAAQGLPLWNHAGKSILPCSQRSASMLLASMCVHGSACLWRGKYCRRWASLFIRCHSDAFGKSLVRRTQPN